MKTPSSNEKQLTKKSVSRVVLQVFVWALIIAFVSTLGVMWDGSGEFPVVIKSSKGQVDLSPRDLYMIEYNRLDKELKEKNTQIDPRTYSRYIRNISLTNTMNAFLRKTFYQEIKITPSIKMFQEIQNNTGLSSNFINFQYAESYYNSPLGLLPVLVAPTVSDMYAVNDLQKFIIATEIVTLNKTNFLYAQLSEEEKSAYYEQNFDQWLDEITIQEFKIENRGDARRVIALLKEKPLEEAILELNTNEQWLTTITTNKVLLASNNAIYPYFQEVLQTYKNKEDNNNNIVITGPIYHQGDYYVALVQQISPWNQLNAVLQLRVALEYLTQNFDKIEKLYNSQWKEAINQFKDTVAKKESFSTIANQVMGAVNHTTQPFTLLQSAITNVLGVEIELSILTDPIILKTLLDTAPMQISPVVESRSSKDVLLAFRPLEKQFKQQSINIDNIYSDPQLYQNVYQYKAMNLRKSLHSEIIKEKYKIKLFPEVLTNLTSSY